MRRGAALNKEVGPVNRTLREHATVLDVQKAHLGRHDQKLDQIIETQAEQGTKLGEILRRLPDAS